MSQKAYEYIKLVQSRHSSLELTYEQAEKMYTYEQLKATFSEAHVFSAWEEWDFELSTFREILGEVQLQKYESYLHAAIEQYTYSLAEQDSNRRAEIPYHEERLQFAKNHFDVGGFLKTDLQLDWLIVEKAKLNYLRMEFERFLGDALKEILTSHFRHNRTYMPNGLKVSLLCHQLLCTVPDYTLFKHAMDEPTKAVADYLYEKLRHMPATKEDSIHGRFDEWETFCHGTFLNFFGSVSGWHVVGHQTAEQKRENRIMAWFLIEQKAFFNTKHASDFL